MDLYHFARTGEMMNHQQKLFVSELEDRDKETVLTTACIYGHLHIVEYMLSLKMSTHHIQFVFMLAISQGHLNIVKRLLHEVNMMSLDDSGRTPLHRAVEYNHIEIVRELIRCNFPINSRTFSHITPLLSAIIQKNVDIVRLLLEHDATVHFGETPYKDALWTALIKGSPNIVTEILRTGKFDDMKTSGIIRDVLRFKPPRLYELIHVLLEHGFDPNVDDQMDTALILACKRHSPSICKLLLRYGADPNKIGYVNDSPILWSVLNLETELVRDLLDCGADVNTMNCHGLCILDLACIHKIYPIIDLLIERGATITIKALLTTIERNLVPSIHILLTSGLTLYTFKMNRPLIEEKIVHCKEDVSTLIRTLLHMSSCTTLEELLRFGYQDMIHTVTPLTWYTLLPYSIQHKWDDYVVEAKQTTLACYLAIYEEQDTMNRFRRGEDVNFSESRLRQLMRPYGARPIRNRVVRYLVHPHRNLLFGRFRLGGL